MIMTMPEIASRIQAGWLVAKPFQHIGELVVGGHHAFHLDRGDLGVKENRQL